MRDCFIFLIVICTFIAGLYFGQEQERAKSERKCMEKASKMMLEHKKTFHVGLNRDWGI